MTAFGRLCAIALVTLAALVVESGRAEAQWNLRTGTETQCSEHVIVVGRCGEFAAGWHPWMLRLEVGPVFHHTLIDAMTGEDEAGNPTGRIFQGGVVEARGGGMRTMTGYRGYYVATDMAMAWVHKAPPVSPVGVTPAPAEPRAPSPGGWVVALRLGIGKELRFGRIMFGGELGVGVGIATAGEPPSPYVSDARLILDARGHAGVWLTRHISVSGFASTSLFSEDRTYGISLGLSLFPWDGIR